MPGDIPPTRRPWAGAIKTQTTTNATSRAQPDINSYVPSVLLPAEAARSPTVHKIHILGEDERSKFIAHALSGLYESVEMLGWTPRQYSTKYRNIQRARSANQRAAPVVEKNAAIQEGEKKEDNSHIDQLILTGHGHEAVSALESVKNRITKDTTVCLMSDGLGVLEDVRRKVFAGSKATPDFLLGHMSHKLAFNRKFDAVKTLRFGQLMVTTPPTTTIRTQELQRKVEMRTNFVKSLESVEDLNSSMAEYDQWLRFKLPSIIFNSVAETVCVLLDLSYQGLLQNPSADRMMNRLLSEIIEVLENMPELRGSIVIRDFVQGRGIRRLLYNEILAKRSQPSFLVRQLERGLPTDVNYLNGFFIRRGRQMGIDLRFNTMMTDMVKARHSQGVEKLNSYIPLEETSVPSELGFRYRRHL